MKASSNANKLHNVVARCEYVEITSQTNIITEEGNPFALRMFMQNLLPQYAM